MAAIVDEKRLNEIRRLRMRGAAAFVAPLMVVAMPFLGYHGPLIGLAGLVCGLIGVYYVRQANNIRKEIDISAQYKPIDIPDCSFADRTYLGHGVDFASYRETFDRHERELGRLAPEERDLTHKKLVSEVMKALYLSDDDATRHVLVMASTGLGKTELFKSIILSSVIKRGAGCLIFDAKGDESLITSVCAMAGAYHREEDVQYIHFDRPEFSHTYNPLLEGNTRQIVSTMMKLFDKKGEQFFRDLARGALTAGILAIKGQPNKIAFNFSDLAVLFSDYWELHRLFESMDKNNADRDVVWSFLKRFHAVDREGNPYVDIGRYNDRLTGLSNKMLDFSHSEYRAVLNDYSPDIELKSAILSNKIIVVVIPALSDKEGVEMFGKLFLGDFARAVGQIQQERNMRPSLPFFAFLDEYASFADESHIELWQQARSANVSLWCAIQGKGFMAKVGNFFFENLASTNWHQLYFDIPDPSSREHAAKLAGTHVRQFRSDSTSESFSYSHENARTGAIRQEARSRSHSSGMRDMREDLLLPDDFIMDKGNAILVGKHGTYRMVTPMVKFDIPVPRLEEIKLSRQEKHSVVGLNLMRESLRRANHS